MLIAMAVVLVLLVFVGIMSKIGISRRIAQLEVELFGLIEEQRRIFRQVRQAKSDLKSAEKRQEAAQHECDELQTTLLRIHTQVSALTERGEKRKEHARGQRPF